MKGVRVTAGSGGGEGEESRGTGSQFVLPPDSSHGGAVEPAAAAAPHAQVLSEQLVHTFLTVPFAGRFPNAYKAAVALLQWPHGRANQLPVAVAPSLKAAEAFGQDDGLGAVAFALLQLAVALHAPLLPQLHLVVQQTEVQILQAVLVLGGVQQR